MTTPPDDRRRRAEFLAESRMVTEDVEILLMARCAACGEEVARAHEVLGDSLLVHPWGHLIRRFDADHRVLHVRVG
jgi:hypothetical protein